MQCQWVRIDMREGHHRPESTLLGVWHLTPVSLLVLNTVPEIIRHAFVKTLGSVPFLCERFMVIKAKTDIGYQRTVIDAGLKGGV